MVQSFVEKENHRGFLVEEIKLTGERSRRGKGKEKKVSRSTIFGLTFSSLFWPRDDKRKEEKIKKKKIQEQDGARKKKYGIKVREAVRSRDQVRGG